MAGRTDLITRRLFTGHHKPESAINANLALMAYAFANPWPCCIYPDSSFVPPPHRWANHLIIVESGTGLTNLQDRIHVSDGSNWIGADGSDTVLPIPSSGWSSDSRAAPTIPYTFELPPTTGSKTGNWANTLDGWFAKASMAVQAPMPLPVYTRETQPDPADWVHRMILLADGPNAVGGPFDLDQRLRISIEQNYGSGTEARWLGLDGSTTATDTPSGGWATSPTDPDRSFSNIDITLSGWGSDLREAMMAWGQQFTVPFALPEYTRAEFTAGTYTANPDRWRSCLAIITNPLNASAILRADEALIASNGSNWRRFKDSTAAV